MSAEDEEIGVMLVDDHATFRQPLAFMLDREPDIAVVAQAGSLSEAREVLGREGPDIDVAIVDLDLPDGSGVDFVGELRSARPRAMSLILSAHADPRRLARAIEAGAAGVMHKSSSTQVLVSSVRRLRTEGQLLSQQEIIEALRLVGRERQQSQGAQRRIRRLTPREREVLGALAEGLSDKELAEHLHLGIGTVRTHMASILDKLELQSRLQALVFAVRHGLVDIS